MDRRRAAGVLLALAACFACSAAAPTASNQTALDLYEGAPEGCYYNFQHYGEGDRIMTNEPCLNCTCHNRMLMCYLRVCPFTKPIGQDCTVEKRADQCCPIVTCPDVPVDLLTSTSTTSPAEYGATGVGKVDKYGCSISGKYFPEGSKVPPTPNKPCEHCYCIRNMTTCVMQECTLHVDGCTPIYHKDVCCPVRYSCDHPEDEIPLLDDMSTTVRPTPGFLLTTTTVAPVTQMTQDCVHDDQIFSDGTSIKTEKPCEHCYCMKGDIVCVVQECGTPMENEGKNCTSLPPRDGQCCPDTYICEGDVTSTESFAESTTELGLEKLTTLSPPMRGGVEGSGYRNEPDEVPYTASPTESELEGSGDDHDITKPDVKEPMKSDEPTNIEDSASATETPLLEEHTTSTEFNKQIMEEGTDEPQLFTTIIPLKEDVEKLTTSELMEEEALQPHGHVSTTSDNSEESYERATTEYSEPLPTTSDVTDKKDSKPHEYGPSTVGDTKYEESESSEPQEDPNVKSTKSQYEYMTTEPSKPDSLTTIATYDTFDKTTRSPVETNNEADIGITSIPDAEVSSTNKYADEMGSDDIEKDVYSTTSIPEKDIITTELDHAQNTVAVAEDESTHPYVHVPSTLAPLSEHDTETAMVEKESHEEVPTTAISIEDIGMITTEPDKGLNTIPNEINEESSEPSLVDKTIEVKSTESSLPESSTLVPDSLVTKGDQYTITTEPSFRKEDESSVSTHKPKDTSTVKPEFEDEGLIPTEEHSDKINTGSETPYEDITTSIPEYAGITETKHPSSESAMQPLDSSETLPENIADVTPKPEDELTLSTEKITDITPTISEDVTTHEEPSRIPGEGDCLLDGITYKNNSVVPSTNKCHSSCRCASSIIKCDPIICSPPPNYMGNCESVYDPLDSCCPTYVCDHPRETIPPQSDNQMSGTESPVPPPTIECRGDQCEIIPPEKHHDENICGPDGCGDDIQKPVALEPSPEQPVECAGGQCGPSNVGCPNGDCSTVDAQKTPVQLCTGEHCINDVSPEVPETSAPTIESTDCVGESCKQGDCGPNGCDSNVISNPEDAQIECSIDKPCRRKEPSPVAESAPCKGAECETASVNEVEEVTRHPESHETTEQSVKEITQSILDMTPDQQQDTSSEKKEQLPVSEISTTVMPGTEQENTVPVEEIFTESYVTKHEDTQTESEIKEIVTEKPSDDEIEQTSEDKESTESPTIVAHQEHDINKPAVLEEQSTVNPVVEIENNEIKPIVTDEQEKETPAVTDYNTTEKPNLLDENQPSIAESDGQDSSPTSEKEGTENPLESTEESITIKPTAAYDLNEKESEISPEKDSTISTEEEFMQYSTKSPEEEKVNDESTEFEQVATDKTIVQEESTDTPTLNTDEGKEKPSDVEGKGTEKPILTDMYAPEEKPEETPSDTDKIEEPLKDINKETEIPTEKYEESERPTTISQESTEKSTLSGEDVQQIPMVNSEQAPDKDTSIEEDSLLIPVDVKEKPTITPEDVMEGETEPPTDEAYNGTPTSVSEGEGTEGPIMQPEVDKIKPSTSDKEYPEKPTVIDEENKELTPVTEEAITEKTIVADDETKEPADPSSTESEKPNDVIPEENTITDDGHKLKPVDVNVDITETPTDIEKEGTETPVVSEEENKLKPIDEGEEATSKPSEVEEEKPISNEDDIKPTSVEQIETTTHDEREDFTKDENESKPIDDNEEISRKPSIDEESTGQPAVTTDAGEEKPSSYDSDTEKPIIVEIEYKPTEHAEDGTEQPTIEEIGTDKPMVSKDDNKIPMYESEITTETPNKSGVEGTEHPVTIGDKNEIMPSDITDETTKIPTTSEVKDSEKPIDGKGEDEMKITNVGTDRPTTVEEQPSFIDDTRRKEPSAIGDEDELTPVSLDEERTEGSISIEMEGTPKPDTGDESKLTPIGVSEEQSTEEPSNIVPSDEESKLKPAGTEDEVTEKPIANEENNTATPNIIEDESNDKPFGTEGEGSEKPSVIVDENKDKPTDVEEEPTEKPAVTDVEEPFDEKASTESAIAEDVNKDMASGIEEGVKDKIDIPEEETKKPPSDYESATEKHSEEESKEKPTGAEEEITVKPVTTEETNKPADVEEEGSPMIIDEDVNEKPAISSDDQIKYPEDIDSEKPDEVTTEPKPVGELQPEIQTEKYIPETLEEGSGMELQTPEHETVKPAESTETESQNETKPPYHEVSTKSSVQTTSSEFPAEEIVTSPASHQMEFESTTKFTETVETVTKSSESSEISEQEEPMAHTQTYESDSPSLSESGTTLMEPHGDNISTKSPVTEFGGEIDRKTTSELPEQSLVTEKSPESFEDDLHSTGSPEAHDIESGITVTQVPIRTDEEKIKTENTEAYIPEKESTESSVSSVTEPVRSFTEFEESSVTEQEQMVTGYPEKVTESQDSAAIEKDNEITAIPPDTPEAETEKDVAEHFESHTTKMPVTESQETSHTTTVPLEIYTNEEVTGTEIPLSHVTDSQNTQTKLEGLEITETPEIPTSGDETTVEDTHKSSTESVTLDDMQTELPTALITSEAPQSLITDHDIKQTEIPQEPESVTTKTEEGTRAPETYTTEQEKIQTEDSHVTEPAQSIASEQDEKLTIVPEDLPTESQYTVPSLHETQTEAVTSSLEVSTTLPERTTESLADEQATEVSSSQSEYSETTPYLIELEEHTHKMADESSTPSPFEEDHATTNPDRKQGDQVSDATTEKMSEIEVETHKPEIASSPIDHSTVGADAVTTVSSYKPEDIASASETEPQKSTSAPELTSSTEKEATEVEKEEPMNSTPKGTTAKQEEEPQTPVDDRFSKPEEKPSETSEILPPGTTAEVPKPGISDMQPTDEMPAPEEDGHFPPSGSSGYGEPDYAEEDQAFGPGTCRYGGKVYVSAQQIPRDDPCDFCFCFRSDIICLQQSCPPPIHGCHEEPIQGFCCPRYECPVSMATTVNVTTTTTTTTTTLPPHFPTHSYKGAAQRRGCQIKGHTYKVGEVVRSSSGPCLHCTCGGDGQMKCDPKACTPEPMLRQMIAAAVSAKRRR